MKIAVQIPIKGYSERIKNKNFHPLLGKPLCCHVLEEAKKLSECWDVFIDTDTPEKFTELDTEGLEIHTRHPWFASDAANGNHLLWQFACHHMDYDVYVQLFVTAVGLKAKTVKRAVDNLLLEDRYDSTHTVVEDTGWYWKGGKTDSYDADSPAGLPRSQDDKAARETTGMYAIRKHSLLTRGCRVGHLPLLHYVTNEEALDINDPADLLLAEKMLGGS